MKVETTTQNQFKPVTLKLTFETEREYKYFYQLIGSTSADERAKLTMQYKGSPRYIYDFEASDDIFDNIFRELEI